jgi:uncharacterized RDD family membrane protein YckC
VSGGLPHGPVDPSGNGSPAFGSFDPAWAYAGFGPRLLSAFVDWALLALVAFAITAAAGWTDDAALTWRVGGGISLGLTPGSVPELLSIAYFTYLHAAAAGQSVGNRVAGVRVADIATREPLPHGRALLRVLVSFVSEAVLLIGFLWMLWDPKNQTWHDKAARSVVLLTSASPPPGPFGRRRRRRRA